jgi:Flp pilus assembly protein TadG
MIEAAYVLPIMMVMVLLIVDLIGYVADRLLANDVMADAYQLMMNQANAQAADPNLTLDTVTCQSNKVELNSNGAESFIKAGFSGLFNGLEKSAVNVDIQKQPGESPSTYIFNAQFPSQTLFLPDAFAQSFPVKAKLIISFDLSC